VQRPVQHAKGFVRRKPRFPTAADGNTLRPPPPPANNNPKRPTNNRLPRSPRLNYKDYVGIFPGFLHMMHHPENFFPPEVKTILMSQSDFQLPAGEPRDYSAPKKYDFTYAQSVRVVLCCVGRLGRVVRSARAARTPSGVAIAPRRTAPATPLNSRA